MADSLPELESQRSKILRQFSQLGDLRPAAAESRRVIAPSRRMRDTNHRCG